MKEDLKYQYNKQTEELVRRQDEAIKKFGTKVNTNLDLNGLEKALNPENQHDMISLYDFYGSNPDILCELIFNQLVLTKWITLYDDKNDGNGIIICKKPYTDYYLKPVMIER